MAENERRSRASLWWVLSSGFVLRVALAPLFGGFGYDMDVLRNWARTLADRPLARFYDSAIAPDHLPGDLWILKLLVRLFHLLGGADLDGTPFLILLKLVPTLADTLVGLAIFEIVTRFRSEPIALKTTAFYTFNPATIFLTSVWGQWDSVSTALLLFAFILIQRQDRLWIIAAPLLAWAVVIKPPLAIVALLLCVFPLRRLLHADESVRRRLWTITLQVATAAFLGLGSLMAIIVPFDVGFPGMGTRWSILERMSIALDLYPYTTLGAFNVWMITIGSLERVSDLDIGWFSMTAHRWGMLLSLVCISFVAFQVIGRVRIHPVREVVAWGAVAVSLAIFMVPTRVHERYLFPAIVFVILYAGLRGLPRQLVVLASALSLTFFLNLALVYGGFRGVLPDSTADVAIAFLFRTISIFNVIIFVVVLALPRFSFAFGDTRNDSGGDLQEPVLR